MKLKLSWVIVILVAVVILAGYFLPISQLQLARYLLVDWAVTLAGVATLVGVVNLLGVHGARIRDEKKDWFNSLVLIAAFLGTFVFGLVFRPSHPIFTRLVTSIQFPVEASLLALLSVTLAAALIRAIRPGMNRASVLFIGAVLIFIWAGTGFIPFEENAIVQPVLSFLNTLQIGGARGILLGIGLGALTAGLRVVIGKDIPSGK